MSGPNDGSQPLLDASAVLAVLFEEAGADTVRVAGPHPAIGAVNAAEVLAKLVRVGMPIAAAVEALESMHLELVPFGIAEAVESARLATVRGLSLGDRACLATAKLRACPVLTADRHWKGATAQKVVLIR